MLRQLTRLFRRCPVRLVYQVPQLRAALGCREFANDVHDNDSVELSCGDFKTHGEFARFCFPRAGS
jgi:hypothetical protein